MENIDLINSFNIFYEKYKENKDIIFKIIIDKDVIDNFTPIKKISLQKLTNDCFKTIQIYTNYREVMLQDWYIDLIKKLSNKNFIIVKSLVLYEYTGEIVCEYLEYNFDIQCDWQIKNDN